MDSGLSAFTKLIVDADIEPCALVCNHPLMQAHIATDAARSFLNVVWNDPAPDDAALSRAIDRLLAASHDVPASGGGDLDLDPPEIDGSALYAEVASRFPHYGLYPLADPIGSIDDAIMMGDAIDDLADLTRDLREVVWRGENSGPADADWSFRLPYFHWGRHARELSLYLHSRQFG